MPHPIDVHVGEQVKLARELRGCSQGAVGNMLNVSFQQVQKYEKGANRISASSLFRICQFLDIPVHAVFEGLEGTTGDPLPSFDPKTLACAAELALLGKTEFEAVNKLIMALKSSSISTTQAA